MSLTKALLFPGQGSQSSGMLTQLGLAHSSILENYKAETDDFSNLIGIDFLELIENIDLEDSVKFLESIIEIKKGTINQYVILLFQNNELLNLIKNRFPFTFDNYINVNDNNFNNDCKFVFESCTKSFDQKRGSLDLHIYDNIHEHKRKSECNHEELFQ